MKKVLILGAAGFVGNYLIDHIQKDYRWSIAVTKMPHEKIEKSGIDTYDLNILDKESISVFLHTIQPDYIFHLAAQSSVALSWENPGLTVDVNIKGSLNVLDVVRELDYKPRVLLIGSGEEYGYINPHDVPIAEDTLLKPSNIYAATKACQNMMGGIYAKAYGMNVMMVRAFNHIGPSQAPLFVVADFCKQVAEIEAGIREPIMKVGNLNVSRDFSDVRDVVRSYTMLIERGHGGETYNVASGEVISIREILNLITSFSNREIQVETDPARLRPADVPIIQADIKKLVECTGWKPLIPLEQTLHETLDYWRKQCRR